MKTREELLEIIMQDARTSGKCDELESAQRSIRRTPNRTVWIAIMTASPTDRRGVRRPIPVPYPGLEIL
jgi:hypothetical protein